MKFVAIAIAALAAIQQPSAADAILAKLDAYLAAYEPRLSELIADETMKQEVRRLEPLQPSDTYRGRRWARVRRDMTSEVAFISLPGNGAWIGFRRVRTVNAQPVDAGDASLRSTLTAKAYDAALALWTARRRCAALARREMRETFPGDDGGTGTGVATYSNFRRFQTSARIVPQ